MRVIIANAPCGQPCVERPRRSTGARAGVETTDAGQQAKGRLGIHEAETCSLGPVLKRAIEGGFGRLTLIHTPRR